MYQQIGLLAEIGLLADHIYIYVFFTPRIHFHRNRTVLFLTDVGISIIDACMFISRGLVE